MHEEYVLASLRAGAARGEPSQQLRAFLVPSDLIAPCSGLEKAEFLVSLYANCAGEG
jgi:hypothetical protein